MRALFRQGMSALALLLVGTSIASAFPVNNQTTTSVVTSGNSGDTTLIDVSSGAIIRNNVSTATALFSTVVNSSVGGQDAPFVTPGTSFSTYCVELTENLVGTIQTAVDQVPYATPAPDGQYYAANTSGVLQRAAWVIGNASSVLGVGANNTNLITGVQLALWEILYEAADTAEGNVNTLNSGGKGFKASGFGATAQNYANTLLTKSYNGGNVLLGAGIVFRQNVKYNSDGTYTDLGGGQTVLAAVPEPTSLAIAGLGALGFLGHGLRRRMKRA